ncbi:MAG: hypothetical protein LBH42_09520, partial [Treponema sp.]|nr:hypothetical protein [Treponema sp.]
MKRIILTIFVLLTGITVFAQSADMSNYTAEYNRSDATFIDRFEVLQIVQDANLTGIGEFYHECLKGLINKIPDIKTKEDWEATEASAIILCKGLAAEKYTAAAQEIWSLVQEYSTVKSENDGIAMQEALIALGQVGDNDYVPHVVQSLNDLITQETSDVETKRRIQRGAAGAINALEA